MENKEVIEEEVKELYQLKRKIRYVKELARQIVYDIQQNQPREFLLLDTYLFARYVVQHAPIQIKFAFKDILLYLERFYNDMTNNEDFEKIVEWFSRFEVKEFNKRFLMIVFNHSQSSVEQRLEEEKVNDLMRIVINYIHEHKTVSYTQLLRYLYSNKYFIPEDILLKELQKLESQKIISIQYKLEEGIPFLIELVEK